MGELFKETWIYLDGYLSCQVRYALIGGRYGLIRAGTFLLGAGRSRYVLLGARGICRYDLIGAGTLLIGPVRLLRGSEYV